jgi:hypothetical protein
MEYYHIVLETRAKSKGRRNHLVGLDKTEEEARHLADSLARKESFLFEGEKICPPQVHRVSLFRTAKPAAELVLPNGRSIADYKNSECKPVGCCKHRFIARCFEKGKTIGVSNCTKEIMASRRGGD